MMDKHIKIEGVCIGMTKSEAWDILKNRAFNCDANAINSISTVSFCNAQVRISYMFDDKLKVNRIYILWTKRSYDSSSRIGKSCLNDAGSVYNSFDNYFNNVIPSKERDQLHYNKYIDLYNHVSLLRQDESINDKGHKLIECVVAEVNDFVFAIKDDDKDLVLFARNSYINRAEHATKIETKINPQIEERGMTIPWFKIAIAVILFIVGFLFVQNNRYYYTNKGKVMVDKWTKEYYYLNSNGKYIKK